MGAACLKNIPILAGAEIKVGFGLRSSVGIGAGPSVVLHEDHFSSSELPAHTPQKVPSLLHSLGLPNHLLLRVPQT